VDVEIWKDLDGYQGLYQVSNTGHVRSLDRIVKGKNNSIRKIIGKELKQLDNGRGRYQVQLCDGSMKQKSCLVNRLVANAFLNNVNGYNEINHKDENPFNNHVDNLEWCTRLYNINYGTGIKRASKNRCKKIMQFDFLGNFIKTWDSVGEAIKKSGCGSEYIASSLQGKYTGLGLYVWKYVK
jgi:hypothetical protein